MVKVLIPLSWSHPVPIPVLLELCADMHSKGHCCVAHGARYVFAVSRAASCSICICWVLCRVFTALACICSSGLAALLMWLKPQSYDVVWAAHSHAGTGALVPNCDALVQDSCCARAVWKKSIC